MLRQGPLLFAQVKSWVDGSASERGGAGGQGREEAGVPGVKNGNNSNAHQLTNGYTNTV